jgi:hypothetical protein
MLDSINYEAVQAMTRVQIRGEEQVEALEQSHQPEQAIKMEHASALNPLEEQQICAQGAQDGSQRTLLVRFGQKIQAMPR